MRRAREAILARGGAANCNVFTRVLLALFGIVPWRGVPVMPVEIMLLPRWFPFHLDQDFLLGAHRDRAAAGAAGAEAARAQNPRGVTIDELFLEPPDIGPPPKAPHQSWGWFTLFRGVDAGPAVGRAAVSGRAAPARHRQGAVAFVTERLNGEDGLGAIFPAMANSVMMFDALGYRPDYPDRAIARKSIEKLLVVKDDEAYCQPCVSPVWDTALACHALLEVGGDEAVARRHAAARLAEAAAGARRRGRLGGAAARDVRPGGWAFQYANPHYPDLDDTAVVVMAMDRAQRRAGASRFRQRSTRGREWVEGLQSRNGGWAAFDADNTFDYLNNIPFADHGALLDPPTEDVTARCVSMLAQLGERRRTARRWRAASTICAARSLRTAAGTAAGA